MHFPSSAAPEFVPCKVCGEPAPFYGMADFNRACLGHTGVRMPFYGFAVYYRRCPSCEFLFTDAFDQWSHDDFRTHMYNSEYARLDPQYADNRPAGNAGFIAKLLGAHKGTIRALDFGGGNGRFAECLRGVGFATCDTYDPFTPGFDTPPDGTYNLITCFETIEHTPDPGACVQAITERLAEDGVVVFSTLLQPANFDQIGMKWWYIGPRNGHISIHSQKSLARLWERYGCVVESVDEDMHMAARRGASERISLGGAVAGAA
jgi:2-polyprenyl-6-hydroxyphenyl methylase/3-demethylubiquinone-9 3-methyltransferase